MSERILIVEDEATLRANIQRFLERAGHVVSSVETGTDAIQLLDQREFDVVLTDLRLPGADGFAVLDRARTVSPDCVVLLMTAYASLESAVDALRRGAHDYLLKPVSLASLGAKVQHIAAHRKLVREYARLRTSLNDDEDRLGLLRLESASMRQIVELVEKVAPSSSNVLIQGESGTGKEVVARAIHDVSPRREGAFVPGNVSAMPENLVESYLFGHERGAFTGAERQREGLFRAASGGTIFLDEIGELPLSVQGKLLRVVETKEILPVGSDRATAVDTRVVCASHRDLLRLARDRRFREDLFYRLSVVTITVPPLRDRVEDIVTLVRRFVVKQSREQKKHIQAVTPEALQLLVRYPWPGNVRELSNVIERAVLLCDGHTIGPADLPQDLRGDPSDAVGWRLDAAMDAFERRHVAAVLATSGGNREKAALLLGISPAPLYRRLEKLALKGYRAPDPSSSQS